MRKAIIGMVSAAALALPLAGFVTSAGATAPATPTCKTVTGSATFTPALPVLASSSVVKSTVAATGKATACTGGGVTSATMSSSFKFAKAGNCASLAGGTGGAITGPVTLKWNTGKTTTVGAAKLQQSAANPFQASVQGKVTAGLFPGKTLKLTITFAPTTGECTTKPLSKVTFTQVAPGLTIK